MKKLIAPFSSSLAWALVLLTCSPQPKEEAGVRPGAPVQIVHPGRADLIESIELNATTVFLKKETVRATFQGFIDRIDKNLGDEVKAGDRLMRIRTKESAAENSLKSVYNDGRFLGAVDLCARADGVLTALHYNSGDYVAEGEELAVISNPSSLAIELHVPYPQVSKINRRGNCTILLPSGDKLAASIQRIIPSVDPASQTQTFLLRPFARVELPENLNVSARLPLRSVDGATVLPRGAILSDETQEVFGVMKLIDDTTAVRMEIVKGIETDSLVQILRPSLSPADRIVADGAYGLPDTARIIETGKHDE
jgi:multidrug efflux pump subunit AcrA (membrane-fusion protein)